MRQACSRYVVHRSRFREDDVLRLHRGSPFFAPNFLLTLAIDDGTQLQLASDDAGIAHHTAFDARTGWVLDEGFLNFSP